MAVDDVNLMIVNLAIENLGSSNVWNIVRIEHFKLSLGMRFPFLKFVLWVHGQVVVANWEIFSHILMILVDVFRLIKKHFMIECYIVVFAFHFYGP